MCDVWVVGGRVQSNHPLRRNTTTTINTAINTNTPTVTLPTVTNTRPFLPNLSTGRTRTRKLLMVPLPTQVHNLVYDLPFDGVQPNHFLEFTKRRNHPMDAFNVHGIGFGRVIVGFVEETNLNQIVECVHVLFEFTEGFDDRGWRRWRR